MNQRACEFAGFWAVDCLLFTFPVRSSVFFLPLFTDNMCENDVLDVRLLRRCFDPLSTSFDRRLSGRSIHALADDLGPRYGMPRPFQNHGNNNTGVSARPCHFTPTEPIR